MTSTISIFDEFHRPVEELSESERHRKRIELERMIFSILKLQYGKRFGDFWQIYSLPVKSTKQIVIIERRIHENLEFLLQNCAWAGSEGGWSLAVVCSDMNQRYVEEVLGPKKDIVQVIPWFKGNPDSASGKREYNELLQTAVFYELFQADTLCLVEMDCYFRKQIPEIVTTCDYLAAPYAWNLNEAGGGLSFRNRKAMLTICQAGLEMLPAQDVFACRSMSKMGFVVPPLLFAKDIVAESIHDCDPVGVHQWWTFFDPSGHDAKEQFERFMTIDIR
jgi:hypothetical protein